MTGTRNRDDDLLEGALARLYDEEVARARDDLALSPLKAGPRIQLGVSAGSIVAVAVVIGLVVLVAPRLGYLVPNGAGGGPTATPIEPSSPTVSGTNPGRVPGSIQGQRVLTPDEAEALIARSGEGIQLLVGGWLHAAAPMSCPVGADEWQPCHALPLYGARSGGRAMFLYGIDQVGPVSLPPAGSAKGIVLSVHTRDPACDKQACETLPVVEAIIWIGPLESATYVEPAHPSSSVAATDAVAAARTLLPQCYFWQLLTTTAGAFGDLVVADGDVEADRWVWAVTFATSSTESGTASPSGTDACPSKAQRAVVYVDYVDGMPLEADVISVPSPLPSG